uniref:Neuralized-like protein 4-like n=1 Tax=Saccoglossus kowalevskii TaxID=10224 RepID=A0ABM0MU95_SACKO|nr:PREDICTED: neuralized-like protein 4-like [Saccoglossus kowalevskii]
MCYCKSCHKIRGDKAVYKRGDPAKDYVLPLGWARFPLNVSVVKSSYHVVFHGTETDCLEDILNDGLLLPDGMTTNMPLGMTHKLLYRFGFDLDHTVSTIIQSVPHIRLMSIFRIPN